MSFCHADANWLPVLLSWSGGAVGAWREHRVVVMPQWQGESPCHSSTCHSSTYRSVCHSWNLLPSHAATGRLELSHRRKATENLAAGDPSHLCPHSTYTCERLAFACNAKTARFQITPRFYLQGSLGACATSRMPVGLQLSQFL